MGAREEKGIIDLQNSHRGIILNLGLHERNYYAKCSLEIKS